MSNEEKKPFDLGNLDLGMGKQPAKKKQPAYKETGHKKHVSAAKKAKAKGERDKRESIKHTSRNVKKTPAGCEEVEQPLIPPTEDGKRDAKTMEGRLAILYRIAEGDHGQEAIRAIEKLNKLEMDAQDPTDRIDPAAVCSYISRAQLYGEDPAKVLLQQHGLYKVAKALALSLGLDQVKLVSGDESGDYSNLAQ
jgi:hypothetical protein